MKEITLDQVKERLINAGWSPERNQEQEAFKQIEESIVDAKSQGFSLQPCLSVETFFDHLSV